MTRIPIIDRLADMGVYDSTRMCPPPAEQLDHVVQFEFTTGCKWNACTYCTMYRGEEYRVKTYEEFREHVDGVWTALEEKEGRGTVRKLTRVFIGGGNALSVDPETLNEGLRYAISTFIEHVGRVPSRVALYSNTRDILEKGNRSLTFLKCGGTCGDCSIDRFGQKIGTDVLYWGIESGSTAVNKLANTGYTKEDVLNAARELRGSGIRISAMIMPGLGGKRHEKEHIEDTVQALNMLRPQFVTFIGLDVGPRTPYARRMKKAEERGENKPLTPFEVTMQTADMIEGLDFSTVVGVHGDDIHTFGKNKVVLGSVKIVGDWDSTYFSRLSAKDLSTRLRRKAKSRKKALTTEK